ncbi:NAD(P)-dependent alcohol dehydrogenase [Streptomyces sp. NPDC002990]
MWVPAVQIAKSLGAEVTGVCCSSRNAELVRSLGADHLIDYAREDFTRDDRRYDLVFDLVGNRSLTECCRALTLSGTLVLSGGGVSEGGSLVGPMGLLIRGRALSPSMRQRLLVLTATPSGENLAALRELAESGTLSPAIDRTYPLDEAPAAIRYLEVEHARAKVVLSV